MATPSAADGKLPDDLDQKNFDVVIIGTGLPESVLAAALARVGKKVVHLDSNDYYGSTIATHTFSQFRSLLAEKSPTEENGCNCGCGGKIGANASEVCCVSLIKGHSHYTSNPQIIEPRGAYEPSPKDNRLYNFDLSPHLLFSCGPTVSTLASSGVSRYLEFKALEKCYMMSGQELLEVPDSRSALFSNPNLDLLEKRMLMKFLLEIQKEVTNDGTSLGKEELEQKAENEQKQLFIDYLVQYKLSPKLINFVLYSIGLLQADQKESGTGQVNTKQGKKALIRYLKSVGRYNNTPFLIPMYGTSELPQAFCRECAVYAGEYMLRAPMSHLKKVTDGWEIHRPGLPPLTANWVVVSSSAVQFKDSTEMHPVERCICVTDRSLKPKMKTLFVVIPPNTCGNARAIHVVQNSYDTRHTPHGKFMIHLSTAYSPTARTSLTAALDLLLANTVPGGDDDEEEEDHKAETTTKPVVEEETHESSAAKESPYIWAAYFTLHDRPSMKLPQLTICPGTTDIPDFPDMVEFTETEFKRICGPDVEFLPTMPDPNDFVWDTEPETTSESSPAISTTTTEATTKTTTEATTKTTEKTSELS